MKPYGQQWYLVDDKIISIAQYWYMNWIRFVKNLYYVTHAMLFMYI